MGQRIGYAKFRVADQSARIEVLDAAGEVLRTIKHDPAHGYTAGRLGGL
jgi:hypothetical protein